MTDHANELRRYARKIAHPAGDVPAVMRAAADEIERLRSENYRLQKEADKFEDGVDWIQRALQAEARIEAMEKQEPVAFALYSGWARKAVYLSETEACEQRDHRQLTADLGGSLEAYRVAPLYLAPGAQTQGERK